MEEFEIKARTCKLVDDVESAVSSEWALFSGRVCFEIPIYQRPYSWQKPQVRKLLTDLLVSFSGKNGKTPCEPMFIGTMQLSFPKSKSVSSSDYHEVIDGQQRLSTLILILKVLRDCFAQHNHSLFRQIELGAILSTRVSNGVQQSYFEKALAKEAVEDIQNPYLSVVSEINDLLVSQLNEEVREVKFDLEGFVTYLSKRVYFVVIETRANLSKTLQIFDAINTAGMDLSGGDIFKVRYFDYLRNVKNGHDSVFDRISALYEMIDEKNKLLPKKLCSIEAVLSLLHHILIERHPDAFSRSLHDLAATTFFERFFDAALNVNNWEGFNKEGCKEVVVEIDELKNLIDVYFTWDMEVNKIWGAKARCAVDFIRLSRYRRYAYLPRLFQYQFSADAEQNQRFTIALSKLLSIYSILKKKSVKQCRNFMIEITRQMFADIAEKKSADGIIKLIETRSAEKIEVLRLELNRQRLAGNTKSKNLVCRYLAMLDELELVPNTHAEAEPLREKLFDWEIDIEHIESANHKNGEARAGIWELWGNDLHGLGNLMILERNINRSISNEGYQCTKQPAYEKSEFATARKQAEDYSEWDLKLCRKRKETEVNRLVKYLCEPF